MLDLLTDNGTLKSYPSKAEDWEQTVKFCRMQDELISSVENVINGNLTNVTDGTYWVSAIRGIAYTSLQGEYELKLIQKLIKKQV